MKVLLIINDAPYGTDRAYNALRLAMALQKDEGTTCDVRVFLLADAVTSALPMQGTPQYIERMGGAGIAFLADESGGVQEVSEDQSPVDLGGDW